MPKKLEDFPGALEIQEYNNKIDKFFGTTFDRNIWEFSDQEIQDLRVMLKLRPSRTRATYISWFESAAKEAANRVHKSIRTQRTRNGVAIQVIGDA